LEGTNQTQTKHQQKMHAHKAKQTSRANHHKTPTRRTVISQQQTLTAFQIISHGVKTSVSRLMDKSDYSSVTLTILINLLITHAITNS
jgi:hypothetical protein